MTNMLHMKLIMSTTVMALTFPNDVLSQGFELKSISDFNHSFRLAKICFLPDCSDGIGKIDIDINKDSKKCENGGYTYYSSGKCPQNTAVKSSCIHDTVHYLICTKEKWCENAGFTKKLSDCKVPEYASQQCQGLDLYKECVKDPVRACKEQNPNYTNVCPSGWQVNQAQACTHDNHYGICCNKCEGYSYTSSNIPNGYEAGASCQSCNGTKYKAVAKVCSGYKTCGSGCSGYGGSCLSGSTTKYSSCQCTPPAPPQSCSISAGFPQWSGRTLCCEDDGGCGDVSLCRRKYGYPDCSTVRSRCSCTISGCTYFYGGRDDDYMGLYCN